MLQSKITDAQIVIMLHEADAGCPVNEILRTGQLRHLRQGETKYGSWRPRI
jgi:hypothetical protein